MSRPGTLERPESVKLPTVAIVGRSNVGKSTLFNKLTGERKAIVADFPGVTRDRNYTETQWAGRRFRLIDTGGLESDAEGDLENNVQKQSRLALAEADVIVLLLDGKSGLNPLDREAVDLLRRVEKPVFYAVNKIDSRAREDNLYDFYRLGLDRIFAISAEHGLGVADLLDAVVATLPAELEERATLATERSLCVAVVGRPNVGKSTLINRLLGFERSVVDAVPGTTRDSIDTPFVLAGESCLLIDTAGIRRKAKITGPVERFSVHRSLRSVDRADLVIHVLDGPEGVTDQDAQILSYAHQRGKAQILAVNKWDLLTSAGADAQAYRAEVSRKLSFLEFVPVVFIAAATGYGIRKMLETAAGVLRAYQRKVPTSRVNQTLQKIVKAHAAPLAEGRAVKFFYGTQTGTRPPTFTLFVNSPLAVPDSYRRYLMHQMRDDLDLDHAPVRLVLRARREDGRGTKR